MTDEKCFLKYLIVIKPLGMLYGSAGPFLSPENLVGRSGNRFPPSTATVAGLYGAKYWQTKGNLDDLFIVGPFWANIDKPEAFYVPTPLNFRVQRNLENDSYEIVERWQWHEAQGWHLSSDTKEKKSLNNSWVSIDNWHQLQAPEITATSPIPVIPSTKIWEYHPHLHPKLEDEERHVVRPKEPDKENTQNPGFSLRRGCANDSAQPSVVERSRNHNPGYIHSWESPNDLPAQQGSLFLENAVQINPDCCLVYLSSRELETGCYRFGGEGHLVDIECHKIPPDSSIANLMQQPMGNCFSILTPAVWGTQRLSYRFPTPGGKEPPQSPLYPLLDRIQSDASNSIESFWSISALMTERPIPFRFRLGGTGKTKRLSRGRYAVPAGTVYQVETEIPAWTQWQKEWFPLEGYSYQHWGCGFALPLTSPTNP